ncbi:MAG: O-antigen ligase family protein [Burkholderiaceae bacterium]|nr:MAG: O-antigen ligase family protein [Burkholderiaceae bacterium]
MPETTTPSAIPLPLTHVTELGVFIFFAAMFAIPSGYSYGGVLLLVAGLWMLAQRPTLVLDRDDHIMAYTLLAYFLVSVIMVFALDNNKTDIDQSVRAFLAIPILLLLIRVPVRLPIIWAGIALGVILSAGIAWWQMNILHYPRAEGFLNAIHFGNFALLFAAFCIGGLFWASTQGRRAVKWRVYFTLAILCGLYSVIAGGSRGSWTALPPLAVVFLLAFLNRRNAVRVAGYCVIGAITIAGLFAIPNSPLLARYDNAVSDVTQYKEDNPDTSLGARFEMWQGAAANLRRQPFIGWNQQDYHQALQHLVDKGELSPVALDFNSNLHNNYLQAWVFTGLPGLLSLLALFAVPLWHFGRYLRHTDLTVRALAFLGTSLVAAYACFCLSQAVLRRDNGIMLFVLALAVFWGALRHALTAASPVTSASSTPSNAAS